MALQSDLSKINALKAQVVAVSADNLDTALNTKASLRLKFTILPDPNKEVIRRYSVLHPDEGIARPALGFSAVDGEAVPPRLHEGRLHMRMAVQRATVAGPEVEADDHQIGRMGQDGANRIAHLNTEGSQSDRAGT